MREIHRYDGSVVLYGENDDNDMAIVEPVVVGFSPVPGNVRCVCGVPLQRWSWRPVDVDHVEISCDRCHRVLGIIELDTRVHQ